MFIFYYLSFHVLEEMGIGFLRCLYMQIRSQNPVSGFYMTTESQRLFAQVFLTWNQVVLEYGNDCKDLGYTPVKPYKSNCM